MKDIIDTSLRAEHDMTYDVLRVIATLLVVVGHCTYYRIATNYGGCDYSNLFGEKSLIYRMLEKVTEFIYVFHMPLFMTLSGALFQKSLSNGHYSSFTQLFDKKAKNLLLPFFIVTLCYAVPIKYISGYYKGSENLFLDLLFGQILTQGNTHLWYILTLFFIFIITYFIKKYIHFNNVILLILLSVLSVISAKSRIGLLSNIGQFLLWFNIGMIFERYRLQMESKFAKKNIGILLFADIIIYLLYEIMLHNLVFLPIRIGSKFVRLGVIGLLCLTVYVVSFYLARGIAESQEFGMLRRDSFGVYLYSDPINYVLLSIGSSICGGMLWSNNAYALLFFLIRFIVTLGISILLTELVRKCSLKHLY